MSVRNLFSDMNFEHSRIQVLPDDSERVIEFAGQFTYRGVEFELYYSTSWDAGEEITDFETLGVDNEFSVTLKTEVPLEGFTPNTYRSDLPYSIDLNLERDRSLVFASTRYYFDHTKFHQEFASNLDTFLLVYEKAILRSQGFRKLVEWAESKISQVSGVDEALSTWRDNFHSSPFGNLKVYWLQAKLLESLKNEIFGAGLIEHLLADPTVTEIQINNPKNIWIEANGLLGRSQYQFLDQAAMQKALGRLQKKYGKLELRRGEVSAPTLFIEVRNEKVGTFVHFNANTPFESAVIGVSPLARRRIPLTQLLEYRMLDQRILALVMKTIHEGKSIIVTGEMGSGRSTIMGALSLEAMALWANRRCLHVDAIPFDSFETNNENYIFRPLVEWMTQEGRASVLNSIPAARAHFVVIDTIRAVEVAEVVKASASHGVASFFGIQDNTVGSLPPKSGVALVLQTQRLSDGSRKIVKVSSVDDEGGCAVVCEFRVKSIDTNRMVIGDWHWAAAPVE